MSCVDLHLHLLPGVDDGARDLRASLAHAERLVRAGVRQAVATPHVGHPSFPFDLATLPARTGALRHALERAGIPLRVHPGGEIHPSAAGTLDRAELELLAQGPLGARWVLLEAPFAGIDALFLAGCDAIRARGFGLLIAHPERAAGLLDHGLDALRGQLAAGAVLQVSVDSLLGAHGPQVRRAAERLVRGKLAYVLASDGHPGRREQTLADGLAAVRAAGASELHAWQLTEANPRFLLRHGLPAVPAPLVPRRAWHGGSDQRVRAARIASGRLERRP